MEGLNFLAVIATILSGIAILVSFLIWIIKKFKIWLNNRALKSIEKTNEQVSNEDILLKSLIKIKSHTKLLFPHLKDSIVTEEEYVEAEILNSTLKKIIDDLEIFKSNSIWEYTFASSDLSANTLNRIIIKKINYNKLSELFRKI